MLTVWPAVKEPRGMETGCAAGGASWGLNNNRKHHIPEGGFHTTCLWKERVKLFVLQVDIHPRLQ